MSPGRVVADLLQANAFQVISHLVVPDEQAEIEDALRQQCEVANLVVTTGGTGIAPRDVTPEATRAVCDRLLDGFAELMRAEGRKQTQFAPLSRSVSGTRGRSLIVNLPGSPGGAKSSLEAVISTHSACFNPARRNSDPTRRKPRGGGKAPGNSSLKDGWIISPEQGHDDRDRS